MKEIKLSIIVPIYNVEAYLEKCVKSLCSQELDFAEILLIDDGSTDNCPNIADMLAQKYKNVSVFHKTNGGLGDARNFGVKQAKGKFVMFIDSDDYVDDGISEVEQYLQDGLDVILMGYKAEYLKEIKLIKNDEILLCDSDNLIIENVIKVCTNRNSAIIKIVSREFLLKHKLKFNKGFAEDFDYSGRLYMHINTALVTTMNFYHYIAERESSIMNTYKKQRFYDIIEHSKRIFSQLEKVKISKERKERIMEFVGFNIIRNFANAKKLDKKERKEVYKLLKQNKNLYSKQKPLFMKIFVLCGKVLGFPLAYRLVKV